MTPPGPRPILRIRDVVALIVGIVVGAGIFRTPALVAAEASSAWHVVAFWVAGGMISLIGAACYAELAAAHPHPGGDYHYLRRAMGRGPAFLFGWARLAVIPTGSLALLAYVFGDYASRILPLGSQSSAMWAGAVIVVLTGLNVANVHHGRRAQNILTSLVILGLLVLVAAGLLHAPETAEGITASLSQEAPARSMTWKGLGMAMVFVLLTYGGWNEAAYVSTEMRGGRRSIVTALALGIGFVTLLYVLVNIALLNALGLQGMSSSQAVMADLAARTMGTTGENLISILVAGAALTSANATLLMGSRTAFALGRDYPIFSKLGHWSTDGQTPANALLAQGSIALALVGLGAWSRGGFVTMVEYTAPIFWGFFLLTGISLFVLRVREPDIERPFMVPGYPVTPFLFCASSAYLLYSSLMYTGVGAMVGLAVLAVGVIPLALSLRSREG
jgi:amino acid transporter